MTREAVSYTHLKNLHNIEWYDTDNIKQLEKWGFTIIQANCRSEKYMQEFKMCIRDRVKGQHISHFPQNKPCALIITRLLQDLPRGNAVVRGAV